VCQQLPPEAIKLLNKKTSKKIEEINNAKTKSAMAIIMHKAI
jgi:hypothetical protein